MLVILKENVANLGRTGDVVRVSEGYARNFLLPRNLVVQAREGNLKEVEHHKKVLEKKRLAQRADAETFAKSINGLSLSFSRKVGKNEKLFGSVTAQDIAEAAEAKGVKFEKSLIQLKESLKALGEHTVTVRVQPEVEAQIRVTISKEA
jgi:large subunit ribosomal protein L9